jgi:hypothetical protein
VRVLVSGVPGLGHLVPLLDLAGALQLAGHEVRVATNEELHAVIAGAASARLRGDEQRADSRAEKTSPAGHRCSAGERVGHADAQVMAPSTLKDLLVRIENWPPDVVLHEPGEYAARSRQVTRGSRGSRMVGEARCGQRVSWQRSRIWPGRFGSRVGATSPRQQASTPTLW